MYCVSSVTWSTVDRPRREPACSRGSCGSTTGSMRLCINLSRILNGTQSSEMGLYDLGSCGKTMYVHGGYTRRFTEAGSKVVFTLDPVLFRILANRTRRVDLASGLHSHYKRLTRRERYVSTSPCTHCVCFATGCDPITCT